MRSGDMIIPNLRQLPILAILLAFLLQPLAHADDSFQVNDFNPPSPDYVHPPSVLQTILEKVVDELFASGHSLGNKLVKHYAYSTNKVVKDFLISFYIRKFNVNLSELLDPNPEHYASLADFFIRQLKPDARSLDMTPNALISPVDGTVSQAGPIIEGMLLQVKGKYVPLLELLGGDQELTQRFMGGSFATMYMSPANYHRVHMPLAANIVESIQIPGRLNSVNEMHIETINDLYGTNERLVTVFVNPEVNLPFIMVWVGAMNIGSIETVWTAMNPEIPQSIARMTYNPEVGNTYAEKGEQIGWFNFGSTIIMLFPADFSPALQVTPGQSFQLGQPIGYF
ncbi:archaetidylserine decarboxylase [Parendozoicomonas haliclonae]|uniref:phosphatidylserine decarboxylase n=3 Tax=Parendozoicomonas haliclonae TaxID=1960125 RepID=A0A1X7AQX3_9GAMM|nr:Phosphatidylserine decarboxylase proenzyme [Parendozoicomonas haliclonae]